MTYSDSELDAKLEAHAAKVKALTDNAVNLIIANTERTKAKNIGAGHAQYASDEREGEFLKAVLNASDPDSERQADGKSTLHSLGIEHVTLDEVQGKAALGSTDATGGWVIPNAIVDSIVKPALVKNPYRQLMTIRSGINSLSVDIPFRSASPSRALIAAFGATKENVDLAYNGCVRVPEPVAIQV